MSLDAIFKAYDIRGLYPDEIDEALARRIGNAFAHFTGAQQVIVGHDMRPSSVPLAAAFIEGATLAGADVTDIGLCSTDVVYFAAGKLDAPGRDVHREPQPGAVQRHQAVPGGRGAGRRADRAHADQGDGRGGRHVTRRGRGQGRAPSTCSRRSAITCARSSTLSVLRPLKVVADTANGMGGLVVPKVFEGLPFSLTVLFGELDGTFPNHPADPIQLENLKDLQRAVLDLGADVGLAFDGDADRVFLVDDAGQPVSGSTTTAIVAAGHPRPAPGRDRSCTTSSARARCPRSSASTAACPVRTRVGHSFIKQVMAETGAIFGGEHSAHYYFRDNWRADSGSIAALLVLEQLCRAGVPLSELRKPFERYVQSGEINSRVDDPARGDRTRRGRVLAVEPQDRLDGLTVDGGDWWFNLRPSNTEPLLRLNLEAPDAASCDAHTAEVLARVRGESAPRPVVAPAVTPRPRWSLRRRRVMALDPKLLEILACPEDKGPLLYFADEDTLYNPRLKRRYRVLDGDIPDLLIDDAETVDDAEHAGSRRRPRPTASSRTFAAVTDSLNFLDAVAGLPEQLAAAHEAAAMVPADALPERRPDPQHRRARHGRLGHRGRRRVGRVQRRAAGSGHAC